MPAFALLPFLSITLILTTTTNTQHNKTHTQTQTQVYHPNIDLEGNICLNILREDWKPVLSISSVVYGLQFLFLVSER